MPRPQTGEVTLDDVLITEELSRRPAREPDWRAENEALRSLTRQLVHDPEVMLQSLVEWAVDLGDRSPVTAGVSLVETNADGEEVFRWVALSGTLASHVGGCTPRRFSPCGVCLERGTPVLFSHPQRYFTYFQEANTPFVEGLVLPLMAEGQALGSIWIVTHAEGQPFDGEDVRLMTGLAEFTAAALLREQRFQKSLKTQAQLAKAAVDCQRLEAQALALVENLPGGAAFVVDRDLRYTMAAGEALEATNFQPEDFVGRTIFEMLPPALATRYELLYRQALAGEPFEHEHQAHNRWYISRGTPLRAGDGEIYGVLAVSYDISDRKQAEGALRQSEEQYRTLFDSLDEGLALVEMIYDEQGEIVDIIFRQVNRAYERQGGVYNVVGRSIFDVIPGVEDYWLDLYKRVAKTGEPVRTENYQQDVDRWFDVYFSRVDDNGRFVAIVFADISDRKQREQQQAFLITFSDALRTDLDADAIASRALRMLAEHLRLDRCWLSEVFEQQGISTVGPEYHRSDLSPMSGTFRLSDYPETMRQLVTQPMVIPDATNDPRFADAEKALLDQWHLRSLLVTPLRKGQYQVIWAIAATMTTPRHWNESERVMLEQAGERIWAAVERARAEAALRESEEKYRSLFESINDGFALLEVLYDDDHQPIDCRFLKVSPSFEAQTTLPQAQGKTFTELIPLIEPGWFEHYHQALVTNAPVHFEMYQSSIEIWLEVDVLPYGDPQDRQVVIVFQNINERKQAEANQIRLVEEQFARREAEQANRMKDEFLSMVSHELQSPLVAILGWTRLLRADLPAPDNLAKKLATIERNATLQAKLIQDLLDISRILVGKVSLTLKPIELVPVVEGAIASINHLTAAKGVDFRFVILDFGPAANNPKSKIQNPKFQMLADRDRLQQVFFNLLTNAIKFTPESGCVIVEISAYIGGNLSEDAYAQIRVMDTGIGIAAEFLPHVFDRFRQAETSGSAGGLGLGLAIARHLVELHHGTIEAASDGKGLGSTFTVKLPLHPPGP